MRFGLFLAVSATMMSLQPRTVASAGTDAHRGISCATCHADGQIETPEARPLRRKQEELCGGCHDGAIEASHPTGFRPARALPAAFTTDSTGTMTCSTCHDFHGERRGLLRVETSGREFCLSCHDHGFFDAMADGGASIVMSGHLNASARGLFAIDPYSGQCSSCHTEKLTEHSSTSGLGRYASAANHPVGSKYAAAAGYGSYRPELSLAPDMILPDGRLSCVSCHRPYSRKHGAPPRVRNGICSECHRM